MTPIAQGRSTARPRVNADAPDPGLGATVLARDVLVRSWIRETQTAVVHPGPLRLDLPTAGVSIIVEVAQVSPTGAHRFSSLTLADGRDVTWPELVEAVATEAAARTGARDPGPARERLLESTRRLKNYCRNRAREVAPPELPRWLIAEQDLMSGHPWHPMTKARDGLSDTLDAQYAPELRGSFAIEWFAAHPSIAAHDGCGRDVPETMRRLAGTVAEPVPADWLLVPVHPWQARALRVQPVGRDLLDRGVLRDLGPSGPRWWATSSIRTVARPHSDVQLKLSLGLRITNSTRENTRAEGRLAVHTAALVDAGLGEALARAHPDFGLVLDRGWLGVDIDDVRLETIVREAPFAPERDIRCAGSLFDPRPDLATPPVAEAVGATAEALRIDVRQAAERWFSHYLDRVIEPLLWLHGRWGIGLEAHLQNTLVEIGADGLVTAAWYRDNQGWYAARSAVPMLQGLWPETGRGVDFIFDDELVTERLTYYIGVNHVMTAIAAIAGACGLAEVTLLHRLESFLRRHCRRPDASPAARALLTAPHLPAKANLLTGVDGRDEVISPVSTQSVYVTIDNPVPSLEQQEHP